MARPISVPTETRISVSMPFDMDQFLADLASELGTSKAGAARACIAHMKRRYDRFTKEPHDE